MRRPGRRWAGVERSGGAFVLAGIGFALALGACSRSDVTLGGRDGAVATGDLGLSDGAHAEQARRDGAPPSSDGQAPVRDSGGRRDGTGSHDLAGQHDAGARDGAQRDAAPGKLFKCGDLLQCNMASEYCRSLVPGSCGGTPMPDGGTCPANCKPVSCPGSPVSECHCSTYRCETLPTGCTGCACLPLGTGCSCTPVAAGALLVKCTP